jgi:AraC-like DNA-binding protein
MSKQDRNKKLPNILYSCYSQKSSEGEQFIAEHVFGYTLSGSSENYLEGKTYVFKAGDLRFFRKNQLTKYIKSPPPGGEYRAVSIIMDQETLRDISAEYNLHPDHPYTGEGALLLKPDPLLLNYMDSLKPYLDSSKDISAALTKHKLKEAVMILLETNPELKNVLFDFSEPGKIDLEAYMTKNYKFNVDISRFAYLTGRSLATFKRDFEKVFHTSPNRWLQQKRLHDAYFLLKEKGHKVTDVYMDVGFKDLSHFSFAFKKAYGVTPSSLA